MKLSEEILDAIDGGDECRGRDAQLTEWSRSAKRLEKALERIGEETHNIQSGVSDSYIISRIRGLAKEALHDEPSVQEQRRLEATEK